MNAQFKLASSVGGRLIMSIGIILLSTILSVFVATFAINKIHAAQEQVAQNSLPALVDVNQLSSAAVNIIKQSILMIEAHDSGKMDREMNQTKYSMNWLATHLHSIKKYDMPETLIGNLETVLNEYSDNVAALYALARNNLTYKEMLDSEIRSILNEIEAVEDKISIIKVDINDAILKQEVSNQFSGQYKELHHIEVISDLILSIGALRKDLSLLNGDMSKQDVLSLRQEFNHSLRNIVRILVQKGNVSFKKVLGKHVNYLIQHGQDAPDIFDDKLELLDISAQLDTLLQQNIAHTQDLNTAVWLLVNGVKDNAQDSSLQLQKIIVNSKYSLYAIVLVALIVSFLVSWKFIYKDIVVKLVYLSGVTKNLSRAEFNNDINMDGSYELKDIAVALNSLQVNSKQIIQLNNKLAEKTLKLKQSNEDLTQFAYIASHDLQEPLRMVGSYVQLLKKKYYGKIDGKADRYIDYSVDGCLRMRKLIEGLLDYSRVESGTEEALSINSNELLQEVLTDLSVKIEERNAIVNIADLPSIMGVASQIRIVFANLINNGLKYCEKGVPQVDVTATKLDGYIEFSVRDNGIGIKEEYHKKIFVIFKRLHSRAEYAGTGIGLSVCKKIIERHGGKISLDSIPGEGTTFTFTLPVGDVQFDELSIAV